MDYKEVLRTDAAREFCSKQGATEDNWKSRQKFCNDLNATIEKYGTSGCPPNLDDMLEPFFNNILDCAACERTILSNAACKLIVSLPKVLGRNMHHHLDRFLPVLLKLCASTKSVTAKAAAAGVTSIIQYSTYSPRMLWHVCQVFEDKAAGAKIFATTWLQTLMKEYHKHMHPDKDYETIGRAVALGLEDADPTVRTNSRATYWTYYRMDSSGAQAIFDRLNNHARTALQNDPNNPDKKTVDKKPKGPSRPGSALSEIREQAKKQRMQDKESGLRKNLQSSRSMVDLSIDIRVPARKPEKKEKPLPPPPAEPEKAPEEKSHMSRSAARPPTHRKAASQDGEPVPKSSASAARGLLSAPVRRPRIVATPMGSSQSSRPSSRTGHAPTSRDHHTDPVRPASSASLRSQHSITSPRLKPSSPRTKPSVHVPDGKENATLYASKSRPAPSAQRPMHTSPPKRPISATPRYTPVAEPQFLPVSQEKIIPPESFAVEPRLFKASPQSPPLRLPIATQQSPSKKPMADYDLTSARRYMETGLKHLSAGTLDPLGYRKLKTILEQYSSDLLSDEDGFDLIYGELLVQLHNTASTEGDEKQINPGYNQQIILQTLQVLIQQHQRWSLKWLTPTLSCVVLYRCTCPLDVNFARRAVYATTLVDLIVRTAKNPLMLIDSVTAAINIGEQAMSKHVQRLEEDVHGLPSNEGCYHSQSVHKLPTDEDISDNKQTSASRLRNYIGRALLNHDASELSKAWSQLIEFGLSTLVSIFTQALSENHKLHDRDQMNDLGLLAVHCLNSYDYVVKKAVVPYCQGLYRLMDCNDEQFFGYFQEESEINLMNYYLASIRV